MTGNLTVGDISGQMIKTRWGSGGGNAPTASGDKSVAIGSDTTSSSTYSTSMGHQTYAGGQSAVSMGEYTRASHYATTAMGSSTTAEASYATSMGVLTNAHGQASTAMGWGTYANGWFSTAMGEFTTAKTTHSVAIGRYNVDLGSPSGWSTWIATDPLFIIGNGTGDGDRNNAVTVFKNGNVGIGGSDPSIRLYVKKAGGDAIYGEGSTGIWGVGSIYGVKGVTSAPGAYAIYGDGAGSAFAGYFSGANVYMSGRLGIGTTDPGTASLKVNSATSTGNWLGEFQNGNVVVGLAYGSGYGALIQAGADASSSTYGLAVLKGGNPYLWVRGDGNIGIGTSTPNYKLELVSDSAAKPNGGSWANSSDVRLKTDVSPITNALDQLTKIQGIHFRWINPKEHGNKTGIQGGFIAQDIEKTFPGWVMEVNPSGSDIMLLSAGEKVKSLTLPFEFDALVVESIKELKKENEDLKARLDRIENSLQPATGK
jgi:hypothetical protein